MMKASPLIIGMPVIDGSQWMGGAVYIRNAIYCLASLPPEQRPRVRLIGGFDAASDYVRELAKFDFVETGTSRIGQAERLWLKIASRLPKVLGIMPARMRDIDLTFPTFGSALPGAVPLHWIPDFQHLALPQFFTAAERAQRDESIRAIAFSKGALVLSSEAAAGDFRAAFPDAAVKTVIWRFCTILTENEEGGADPSQAYDLPERYIYMPNQFWAHKNHIVAFRALSRLAEEGLRPVVVCTGQEHDRRNPGHMPMLRSFLAENGLAEQVRFLGLVPRADQIEIFRRASFVLQPSLFEGWSTVVEDSKALCRPVVLSDLPVHREQIADAEGHLPSILFDPHDPERLANVLREAWDRFSVGEQPAEAAQARSLAKARRVRAAERLFAIFREAVAMDRHN